MDRLQLEQVRTCEHLQTAGDHLCVSHGQRLNAAADIVFSPAGEIDDQLCHDDLLH